MGNCQFYESYVDALDNEEFEKQIVAAGQEGSSNDVVVLVEHLGDAQLAHARRGLSLVLRYLAKQPVNGLVHLKTRVR